MKEEILLPSQKTEVFRDIQGHRLNPSEFKWRERMSVKHTQTFVWALSYLPLRNRDYYFEFGFHGTHRFAVFRPGLETAVEERESIRSWPDHRRVFSLWLSSLQREATTSDLWTTVSQEKVLTEAASGGANTPFTPKEQQYISQQLHEIKEYLFSTQDLSNQHREFVTRQLDYLKEAAKRQGRIDWLKMTVGTLLGIVMTTALTSEAARELFRFAGNALSQLLGGTLLLP